MRNNLRNYYTNAITNRQKQQNLNSLNEQYDINPADGGSLIFKGGRDMTGKSNKGMGYDAAVASCRDLGLDTKNERVFNDCVNKKMGTPATTPAASQNPPGYGGVNAGNAVQGQQKGGYVYDDGGFVYASNVYPFIL